MMLEFPDIYRLLVPGVRDVNSEPGSRFVCGPTPTPQYHRGCQPDQCAAQAKVFIVEIFQTL